MHFTNKCDTCNIINSFFKIVHFITFIFIILSYLLKNTVFRLFLNCVIFYHTYYFVWIRMFFKEPFLIFCELGYFLLLMSLRTFGRILCIIILIGFSRAKLLFLTGQTRTTSWFVFPRSWSKSSCTRWRQTICWMFHLLISCAVWYHILCSYDKNFYF